MRLFDPAGWPRVFAVTLVGTVFCVAVALYVDSFNFVNLSEEAIRRAIAVNIAVPTLLAAPLLFLLMWKIKQLAQAHRALQVIAATDSLTSVLNRGAFTMLVEAYLEKMENGAKVRNGALLIADVDHFKNINDVFGHDSGDEALKLIARAIQNAVRKGDLVGRIGGEEFGIFLPGAERQESLSIAQRIRDGVSSTHFLPGDRSWPISISVGGAGFTVPTTFERLYVAADRQLYAAKAAGRNCVRFHSLPATEAEVRRLAVA